MKAEVTIHAKLSCHATGQDGNNHAVQQATPVLTRQNDKLTTWMHPPMFDSNANNAERLLITAAGNLYP
jgi:hypothetical protein